MTETVTSAPAGFFQIGQVNNAAVEDIVTAVNSASGVAAQVATALSQANTAVTAAQSAQTAAAAAVASIASSVTSAATSATNAGNSATAAATSATGAASSATAAATSVTSAASSATSASSSATTATTQAGNASTSATAAATSATASATSATASAASATTSSTAAASANGFMLNSGSINAAGVVNLIFNNGSTIALGGSLLGFAGGHLNGLITSRNGGAPNTKIDISAGAAIDEISSAGFMTSAGVLTINAGTTGANGLDTGSLVNNTFYHVYIIGKTDGTVAGFMSTSLTPTLPSGYTLRRRIGSVKTDGGAHFLNYTQVGDNFWWFTPFQDISVTNPGLSSVLRTVNVPPGLAVHWIGSLELTNLNVSAANGNTVGVGAPNTAAPPMTSQSFNAAGGVSIGRAAGITVLTNTAQQINSLVYAYSGSDVALTITTAGWIDTRGRLS